MAKATVSFGRTISKNYQGVRLDVSFEIDTQVHDLPLAYDLARVIVDASASGTPEGLQQALDGFDRGRLGRLEEMYKNIFNGKLTDLVAAE